MESADSQSVNPPPPLNPPPVIAPPPPPARKSRGWMIFALVLLVLLIFAGVVIVSQFVHGLVPMAMNSYRSATGPRLEEVMLEDNGAPNKIAVIELDGIITSANLNGDYNLAELVKAELKRAQDDSKVRAVVLKVNSPGGEVLASDEISKEIKRFQNEAKKPVIVSMGALAASGGYYVSVPCRWIVANELTITGSIGVIMQTWNYRGLMDKVGLQPMVFKSGKFKDMLSGSREPTNIPPEEREMVQKLIDEVYGKFKSVVREGRFQAHQKNEPEGHALDPNWQNYADGRVLSGTEALELGFVDELGDFDTAVERTKKIARLEDANIVEYHPRRDLSDVLDLFGKSETRAVKVDLGLETPKLEAGQLYFLSPTLVH